MAVLYSIGSINNLSSKENSLMKRYDGIALAGALGALVGLSVAVVNAWALLPTLFSGVLGMVVAGIAYRPLEIPTIVWNVCRVLPGAFQAVPRGFRARKEQFQKGLSTTLLVAGCVALTVLSFLAIPVLLSLAGLLPHITDDRGQYVGVVWTVVMTGILSMLMGVTGSIYFLIICDAQSPPWAWRIGKTLRFIWEEDRHQEGGGSLTSGGAALLVCLCVPILLQLMSVGIILFALDAVSTLCLALASTERIAAILGAVLGWGTGVLLHALGIPGDLFLLALGTIVGGLSGRLLYRLREHLSQEPATEMAQSS